MVVKMNPQETKWNKANISYNNYLKHLRRKRNRFSLTMIDLLYIRNFKGLNSSIHEPEQKVKTKLKEYSTKLHKISLEFDNRELKDLCNNQLNDLLGLLSEFLVLTKKHDTKIDGFNTIRAISLLHFYFPKLFPIMDRRVVIAALPKLKGKKQNGDMYKCLIKKYYKELNKKCNVNKTLRDLDKEYFIQST